MSLNSPAKQERIERHLMRQRGAGTRTVSATFGFSFGSSAPPSNAHTPTSLEPPAKCRKTLLQNELCVMENNVAEFVNTRLPDISKTGKARKSRKRWVPQAETEGTATSLAKDENDSFIAGLQAKRTGSSKTKRKSEAKESEQQIDAAGVVPATKVRPRRRAAAKAAAKVTDDLDEERIPVDGKRRPSEPYTKATKSGTTRSKQNDAIDVTSVQLETVDPSDPNNRPEGNSKKAKARSTIRDAIEDTLPSRFDEARRDINGEETMQLEPRERTSRKRKQSEVVSEPVVASELDKVGHAKRSRKLDKDQDTIPALELDVDPPGPKQRKNTSGRSAGAHESKAKRMEESQRIPLKESDPNVTIISISPEKPKVNKHRAASVSNKLTEPAQPATRLEHGRTRPARQRKILIRQDEVDAKKAGNDCPTSSNAVGAVTDHGALDTVEAPGLSLESSRKDNAQMANSQIDPVGPVLSTDKDTKPSKRKTQQVQSAATHEAPAPDEDIDWLFQSYDVKQRPPLPRKKPVTSRKGPRTPKKLVDIDLDDLLSNIASFAKAHTLGCDADGQVLENKKMEKANGTEGRGKR